MAGVVVEDVHLTNEDVASAIHAGSRAGSWRDPAVVPGSAAVRIGWANAAVVAAIPLATLKHDAMSAAPASTMPQFRQTGCP